MLGNQALGRPGFPDHSSTLGYACRLAGASHHRPGDAVSLGGRARGQRVRPCPRRRAAAARAPRAGARALARRRAGARVAPADPARARPELFDPDGGVRVLGVGELLPLAGARRGTIPAPPVDIARTIEEVLTLAPLDFVHVHEPFAPSASSVALRHSRALNVGSFHAPTERVLSTQVARRFVELFFGRLDARTASFEATRELMERDLPGRATGCCAPAASPRHAPARHDGPLRIAFCRPGGARRAAAVPARAAAAARGARLGGDRVRRRPARRRPLRSQPARPRARGLRRGHERGRGARGRRRRRRRLARQRARARAARARARRRRGAGGRRACRAYEEVLARRRPRAAVRARRRRRAGRPARAR